MIMDHLSLKQWKSINRHTITMMGFGICFNGRYHWRILFKICVFSFILLVSEITELRELLLSCFFIMIYIYISICIFAIKMLAVFQSLVVFRKLFVSSGGLCGEISIWLDALL